MRLSLLALALATTTAAAPRSQDLYDLGTLRTLDLTFAQPNYWQQLTNNYGTSVYIKADLTIDGTLYRDVGVRFRGNSSYWALPSSSQKKPFEIALDEFVPGQKVMGYKTLNLNNNFLDPTFVREVLAFDILRNYMPAPGSCYVSLRINGQDWGLYVNTQQINKDLIEDWFPSKDGNRYRGERVNLGSNANATALTYLGSNPLAYQAGFLLKSAENPTTWSDLERAARVLNRTSLKQLGSELPKVLDVDNVLWYLAASNTLLFIDSYVGQFCHNFYLYHDTYHDRMSLLPWDQNSAFGGYADPGQSTTNLFTISTRYAYTASGGQRPLMSRTMRVPQWRQRYDHHLRTIVAEHCNWANLSQRIASLQAFVDTEVRNDPNALYSYQEFKNNVTQSVSFRFFIFTTTIPGLKPTIEGREAKLMSHPTVGATAPVISELAHVPAQPQPGQPTFVTARIGGTVGVANPTVHYRVQGWFLTTPMFDDGMHGEGLAGDGVYGGTVPAQPAGSIVEYYVGANAAPPNTAAVAFAPSTAGHLPPYYIVSTSSAIKINELLADNDTGDVDEFGEFEDWVEVLNTGSTTYDLSGHYLSDNLRNPTKWQFPVGTTVAPGWFLRVWCDDEPAQGPLHASFKLDKEGEEVGLFDSDAGSNAMLDAIVFGQQKGDRSFGRVPDGNDLWFYVYQPSGNAPLQAAGREAVRYDSRRTGSPTNFDLRFSGSVRAGSVASFDFTGGPPFAPAFMVVGVAPGAVSLPPFGPLAVNPLSALTLALALDARGNASLPVAVPAGIQGLTIYTQGVARDFSNALTVRF